MSGNRHQRRAAEARARKRKRCHNTFYLDYIQHLPRVPIESPIEPGVNYLTIFHDESCKFYDTRDLADCDCDPHFARFVEPVRS